MTKHDERAYEILAGAIAGAWMAMQGGAEPAKCMTAVWDILQEQLAERSKREGR